jgi:hypothetical protein
LSTVGGLLSRTRWLALALLALGGCVQQAVLENDITSATWKARTLATATDLRLAEAALAAQLIELEALYQRDPDDGRVRRLLEHGYSLMARGFVEARRLEALVGGDDVSAERERRAQSDAEARARYYRAPSSDAPRLAGAEQELTAAERACRRRDRSEYERELNRVLLRSEVRPEARLEHALAQRLAAAWLMPKLAARCHFEAAAATSAAPRAP